MKKSISLILALVFVLAAFSVPSAAVSSAYSGITSATTPQTASDAVIRFTKSFGRNFKNSPTPPLVVGNTLIVISGNSLLKLSNKDGSVLASMTLAGSTRYASVAPTYVGGVVYCALDKGIVQAVDYKTFKSLWIYTDALGGQALNPVLYDSGFVYTAFWSDEDKKANYVCLNVKDENTKSETEAKKATWTYTSLGGFYWAGAAVSQNYLLFGCDDGESGSTSPSKIVALNKKTGKTASTLAVTGDIRSTVAYDSQTASYYVTSKGGYLYKFKFNSSSGKFDSSSLKSYKVSGASTSTPVVHNKRVYAGFNSSGKTFVAVINADTMKEIYRVQMKGYPQCSVLLSTAYEKKTGKVYVYSTYNALPGGITVFTDSKGQTEPQKSELVTPTDSFAQYCISPISVDSDGTLYFKNDSGSIFAVEKKSATKNNVFQKIIDFIKAFFKKLTDFFKVK